MNVPLIQADYDILSVIANRFGQQGDSTKQLSRHMQQTLNQLKAGGWVGQGATSFYAEMQDEVVPTLARLSDALIAARKAVIEVRQIVLAAEQEAARLFSDGQVAALANAAGASPGSAGTHAPVEPGTEKSGLYKVGPPQKPHIAWDKGFLENGEFREPTLQDRARLAVWRSLLESAELVPGLSDATAAYRHFLDGEGKDRWFSYERYIEGDPSGKTALKNIIADAQKNVEIIGKGRESFSVTSAPYAIGGSDARYPYPKTENWEKAIGGHQVWTGADVQVSGEGENRTYTMKITLHAEDRYNFNPDNTDNRTGIPDKENGIFEQTRLAHQYMNYGELTRVVTWREGDIANAEIVDQDTSRNRLPEDNRRLRNRL